MTRGRGRPKKTVNGVAPQKPGIYRAVEPDSPSFFKSLEKQGGPIFPDICFEDAYNELYTSKPSQEDSADENDDSMTIDPTKEAKKQQMEFDG